MKVFEKVKAILGESIFRTDERSTMILLAETGKHKRQVIVRDHTGKVGLLIEQSPLTKHVRPGDLVEGIKVKEVRNYFLFKPLRIIGRMNGVPSRACVRASGRVLPDGEGKFHLLLSGDPEKLKRFAGKRVTAVLLW